jgi:ceramide glucosyltransferase
MFSEIALALWSGAGLVWWVIAWRLVAAQKQGLTATPLVATGQKLSVFKPLPPLCAHSFAQISPGLESFVAQLDAESEMLLGIHEIDRERVAPWLKTLCAKYPKAELKVIFRSDPDGVANPKIAWQRILASEAVGELWLWSDADIEAPSGFLQSARSEFARCDTLMMTFPYVVKQISLPPMLLEALFVNVEFYPGVLLLRKLGAVDFGLGAAMLFRRDDFLKRVEWEEIGAWLADDFYLGQKLQPVRIGQATLATAPGAATWTHAIGHDLRWTKTIRWNRLGGAFARILIMPVLGWLGAVILNPGHFFAWVGLLGMVQAEVLLATAICRRVGCRLGFANMLSIEIWSFWRIILWFLCWAPGPIRWSGKIWRGPRMENAG